MSKQVPRLGAKITTRAIYHPGDSFELIGEVVEHLANGGIAVRFQRKASSGLGETATADFTRREAERLFATQNSKLSKRILKELASSKVSKIKR